MRRPEDRERLTALKAAIADAVNPIAKAEVILAYCQFLLARSGWLRHKSLRRLAKRGRRLGYLLSLYPVNSGDSARDGQIFMQACEMEFSLSLFQFELSQFIRYAKVFLRKHGNARPRKPRKPSWKERAHAWGRNGCVESGGAGEGKDLVACSQIVDR